MGKRRKIKLTKVTAKFISLLLAIMVWLSISYSIKNRSDSWKPKKESPLDLGPAVNPDLNNVETAVEGEPTGPTLH